jgi:hypothetical protein
LLAVALADSLSAGIVVTVWAKAIPIAATKNAAAIAKTNAIVILVSMFFPSSTYWALSGKIVR